MSRQVRRRQARVDDDLLSRGLHPDHVDQDVMAALTRQTFRELERSVALRSVDPLIAFQLHQSDVSGRWWKGLKTACNKGCWYCCTAWVSANAPQTIYFVKRMGQDKREAFQARAIAAANQVKDMSFHQRLNSTQLTTCPALVDGACSNYDNRPMVCRSATSMDAEICRRTYLEFSNEDVPMPAAPMMVRDALSTALWAASMRIGVDSLSHEFYGSLAAVISNPDIESRWLSGESVLKDVPIDPGTGGDPDIVRYLHGIAFEGW